MFIVVVLLYILCQSKGEVVRYRCSEVEETSTSFTPVDDVPGRYAVELCLHTTAKPNVTLWDIELWYFKTCKSRMAALHSVLKDQSIRRPTNCTNVCYSVIFDLIYTGCYEVHSALKSETRTLHTPASPKYTVNNNLTLDSYKKSVPKVVHIRSGNNVTLNWVLNVPVPYKHEVCVGPWDNKTSQYSVSCPHEAVSCSIHNVTQLWCVLILTPGTCYLATLRLEPPWYPILNAQAESSYFFCHSWVQPPALDGAGAAGGALAWWAAGGALLALGALAAALLVRRALRERDYHKRVIEAWVHARECEAPRIADAEPESHNILLLYAREGDHGQRAIAALKALLQHSFGGQVLDVYAADVLALAAPAPGAWLRGALGAARTKVLLLQSPALLQLYATTVHDHSMQLREPLLGRGALYRRPHFGDQLVLLALRLLAEGVAAHNLYHKYYLATYSGLSGEVLPALVPYRRYEMPRAAATLLQDLATTPAPSPSSPSPSPAPVLLVQQFAQAADEFIEHVRANPDYLADELVTV